MSRRGHPPVPTFAPWPIAVRGLAWGQGPAGLEAGQSPAGRCRPARASRAGRGSDDGELRGLRERVRQGVRDRDDGQAARLRQLRVRDPGARAALRTLRLPRHRPRHRGRGEDVLLCPLRARFGDPVRGRPRRARRPGRALTAKREARGSGGRGRSPSVPPLSRWHAPLDRPPREDGRDRDADRGPELRPERWLRRHAIRVVEEAPERAPRLAGLHGGAAPLAPAAHGERDRAPEEDRRGGRHHRDEERVATHLEPEIERLVPAPIELGDEAAQLGAERVDLPGDPSDRGLLRPRRAVPHAICSFAHRTSSRSERRVVSSSLFTRRAQPHSPIPVPIASTTAATTSDAAQPGSTPPSMSARTTATSRSWIVKMPQSPAAPRPLAVLISLRTSAFSSTLASSTSLRARRLALRASSVTRSRVRITRSGSDASGPRGGGPTAVLPGGSGGSALARGGGTGCAPDSMSRCVSSMAPPPASRRAGPPQREGGLGPARRQRAGARSTAAASGSGWRSERTGAKRSPCFSTRARTFLASKTSPSALRVRTARSTSDQRSGVETVGRGRAR